ncbi:MAG: metal-dependent transcriptional regulator [Victivallales bacterium]|nr:metal-dependent transcriptional regulator [Victivallales bacterium]
MKSEVNLSTTQKNYLLAVYELSCNHGHAHVRSIARKLNVSMPSVIEAMRTLEEKNLVDYKKRQFITLSPLADKVVSAFEQRKKLISVFIRQALLYPPADSEKIAEKMIHCVDESFCGKLKELTGEVLKNRNEDIAK